MEIVLNNIKKISIIDVHQLESVATFISNAAIVSDISKFSELPIVGMGECIESVKHQDRLLISTATLSFNLPSRFSTRNRAYAFLFETLDKKLYIIGSNRHPFCKITTEVVFPGKATDKSVCKVTVEYTSLDGLKPVIIP